MAVLALVFAASCNGERSTPSVPAGVVVRQANHDIKLQEPALISIDNYTGELIYWPTAKGPSQNPVTLSQSLGISTGFGMAANGNLIVIANSVPPEIVTYDVETKKTATYHDNFGDPYDVAIDKRGNIYAMQTASVTRYAAGSYAENEMICHDINTGEGIAVDNEGNVYVNGHGPQRFMGVVEYPVNGKACRALKLKAEAGYAGGVGIDPKTDDLIVIDNPDLCAGGYEGRMIVYKRPYKARDGISHNLNAEYCAGAVRLDAGSKIIYFADATVSGFPFINSRTYPGATGGGPYSAGYSASIGGFTTIPNALPN